MINFILNSKQKTDIAFKYYEMANRKIEPFANFRNEFVSFEILYIPFGARLASENVSNLSISLPDWKPKCLYISNAESCIITDKLNLLLHSFDVPV